MSEKTFLGLLGNLLLFIGVIFLLVYTNIQTTIGVLAIGASIRIFIYRDIKYKDKKE